MKKTVSWICVLTLVFEILSNGNAFMKAVQAADPVVVTVSADNVLPLGKAFEKSGVLTFSYGNSGAEINFKGTRISADFVVGQDNNSPQKIAVFVDGNEDPDDAKMITLTGDGEYTLADNLVYGNHTVKIRKASRSYYGFMAATTIGLKSINLGSDGELLAKSPKKKLSIEVFGDSITNGDAVVRDANGSSASYSWKAYAGEVARYFDADLKSCGISGNGLLRSVMSDEQGIYFNLFTPQRNWSVIDESAGGNVSYDHSENPADVVIINLGTNDLAAFNAGQITAVDFYQEYVRFIKEIHSDCPDAVVVATLGAMGAEALFDPIQRAVNNANAAAEATYAYFTPLKKCNNIKDGVGYDGSHPSAIAHQIYGKQLIKVIESALNEKGKVKTKQVKNVVGEMFMPKSISPASASSLINDSGMSGLEAPNHMHASFDSNDGTSNAMIPGNMYSSSNRESIVIDLGKKEALGEMYLWNYNDIRHLDYDMKTIQVDYSEDGTNYKSAGIYVLGQNSLDDDNTYGGNVACSVDDGHSVDFGGVTGRYVRVTPIDNYGGSQYGLSEIRIFRHKTEPMANDSLTVDGFAPYQLDNETYINVFNNSGLSMIDGTTTSDERHSNNPKDMTILRGAENDSMLILNLDGNYPVTEIKLWNYNDPSNLGIGMKDFDVYYTVDSPCQIVTHPMSEINAGARDYIDWTRGSWKKLGTYTMESGTGQDRAPAQLTIACNDIRAQHIKIVPKSNHGGERNTYGLSEIKVYVGKGWATEYSREWSGILSSSGSFKYHGNSVADNKGSSLRNNNNGRGWTGGDGMHSTSLNGAQTVGSVNGGSKTLFTFQDSYEGNFGNYDGFGYEHGYGTAQNSGFSLGMRNMAYMMLTGDKPDVRNVQFYMQLEDGISNQPGYGGNIYPGSYWLGDSTVVNNTLYTVANRFSGLTLIGADFYASPLVNYGWPSMKSIPERKFENIDQMTPYHETVYEEGDYIYVYGKKNNLLVVSRTRKEDYPNLTGFTYWNGSSWVNDANQAAAISNFMPGNEFNITKMETGTFAGKYVMIHTIFSITGATSYAVADSPTGPFVQPADSEIYWSTEKYKQHMRYYSDAPVIYEQWNYNAKSHPAISQDGELLISYHYGIHDDSQANRVPAYGYFVAVGKEYEHPTMIKMFDIKDRPTGKNLATGKTATASSVENADYGPEKAFDGDDTTRWAATGTGESWITVDLGEKRNICRVVLKWEAAFAAQYKIEVSDDLNTWKTATTVSNGDGGIDDLTFTTVSGRYLRVHNLVRGTIHSYSLYEVEVYGPDEIEEEETPEPTTTKEPEQSTPQESSIESEMSTSEQGESSTEPEVSTAGQEETTTEPEVSTADQEETTTETEVSTLEQAETSTPAVETTNAHTGNIDPDIPVPFGLQYAGNADLPYYFAWGALQDVDGFHVYVNDTYITSVTGFAVNLNKDVFPTEGIYTIAVQSFIGDRVSAFTAITYDTTTGEWAPAEPPTIDSQPTTTSTETTQPRSEPTDIATNESTDASTNESTDASTNESTDASTNEPTDAPTNEPADASTNEPTDASTNEPTDASTNGPTDAPTNAPTDVPTNEPTETAQPTSDSTETAQPTNDSTETAQPTNDSTEATQPTETPTTGEPSLETTENPTATTTMEPEVTTAKLSEAEQLENEILNAKNDRDPAGSTFGKLRARVQKTTKNSNKVIWKKVKGATKYIIYGAKCGTKIERLAEVTTKSYTHKSLNKGTYYKYLVMAVDENGDVVAISKMVHSATKGGKKGNAKKLKLNKSKVTLNNGKKFKLKAKQIVAVKKTKIKKHRPIYFESSNEKIVKVTRKGVLKAKGKGKCIVYVYAQNGVYKAVKITVK